MADAIIDRINPTDMATITHLYNSVFRPEREESYIKRRIDGRRGILAQVARIGHDAVGFYIGFELKPDTHFVWLVGVVSGMRRVGIATQLMHAAQDYAHSEGYKYIRFECDNHIRPFMHFGIAEGYDIVGMRWDTERVTNLIIFQKQIAEGLGDSDH